MTVDYQQLVEEIRDLSGVPDTDTAALAAAATFGALGHVLDAEDRQRVAGLLPGKLRNAMTADSSFAAPHGRREDESGFVADVAGRCHCTTQQARLRAQATLSTVVAQERESFSALHLPDWFAEMSTHPEPGGGVVSPEGKAPPLTDEEIRSALVDLPYWTGDRHALVRTVSLPRENADALLPHLQRAIDATPHGGRIERTPEGLKVTLQTRSVGAVTGYDVDLARRAEQIIASVSPVIRP
jgi:pterin-4a-carbinolamine dehydratase/uncharacterized protein (DUF2267 family)